jgi:hypothetical protein
VYIALSLFPDGEPDKFTSMCKGNFLRHPSAMPMISDRGISATTLRFYLTLFVTPCTVPSTMVRTSRVTKSPPEQVSLKILPTVEHLVLRGSAQQKFSLNHRARYGTLVSSILYNRPYIIFTICSACLSAVCSLYLFYLALIVWSSPNWSISSAQFVSLRERGFGPP